MAAVCVIGFNVRGKLPKIDPIFFKPYGKYLHIQIWPTFLLTTFVNYLSLSGTKIKALKFKLY